MEKPQRISLSARVDVRDLADVTRFLKFHGFEVNSPTDLTRKAFSALAELARDQMTATITARHALGVLEKHGFNFSKNETAERERIRILTHEALEQIKGDQEKEEELNKLMNRDTSEAG